MGPPVPTYPARLQATLLRPLKRKLKDLESDWEDNERIAKLERDLRDSQEKNVESEGKSIEFKAYAAELEDMVEKLQAQLSQARTEGQLRPRVGGHGRETAGPAIAGSK